MSEFDFNTKKIALKIKVDGEEYGLIKPNMGLIHTYEKDGKEDQFEATFTFLEGCGLPKKVSELLEAQHIEKIIQALLEQKKS